MKRFFVLSILFCYLILAQLAWSQEEDDTWDLNSKEVEVPAGMEVSIEINHPTTSSSEFIKMRSDLTVDIYTIKREASTGDRITQMVCVNATYCCFEIASVFIVENKHLDRPAILFYERTSNCEDVTDKFIITYLFIGISLLITGGLVACIIFSRPNWFWNVFLDANTSLVISDTNYNHINMPSLEDIHFISEEPNKESPDNKLRLKHDPDDDDT